MTVVMDPTGGTPAVPEQPGQVPTRVGRARAKA